MTTYAAGDFVGEMAQGPLVKLNKELKPQGMKVCSSKAGCWKILPFEDFPKDGDGLQSRCKECCRKNAAAQYAANPDYKRDHVKENPERDSFYKFNHRGREKAKKYGGRIVKFTLADMWQSWSDRGVDKDSCWYCHRAFYEGEIRSVDHVMPLKRLGDHAPENTVPACRRCNSEKWNRTVDEYAQWLADGNRTDCNVKMWQKRINGGAAKARKLGRPADTIKAADQLAYWESIDVDSEICGVCHVNPAGALDHVIELHKPDGVHQMEWLIPVCDRCNSGKKSMDSIESYFDSLAQVGRWMPVEAIMSGTWDYCETAAAEKKARMNVIEAGRRKNLTECPRGHKLEGDNLRADQLKRNKRACRSCGSARSWFNNRNITPTEAEFHAKADEYYAKHMPVLAVWGGEALPEFDKELVLF